MGILDFKFFSKKQPSLEKKKLDPIADMLMGASGQYRSLFAISYNGEKNMGEIGPIKNYILDYYGLSLRSWESILTNEISSTVIEKFVLWVIGSKLKLQAIPNKIVLKSEGIELDSEAFSTLVEAQFEVWCNSTVGDYSGMDNIHAKSEQAFINSIAGGDVVTILRLDEAFNMTIQLIDGSHVQSPTLGNDIFPLVLPNGNRIVNGIELDNKNQHVAYHIRKWGPLTFNFETERIEARSANGMQMAFLTKGKEYRLDNFRGVPSLTTILETLAKLDRYKEAAVGSAEEAAKIAYQVVHQAFSTGENPLDSQLAKAFNYDAVNTDIPRDQQGKILANTVAVSTNKQAFNNPVGSKIETLKNEAPLTFKDFYNVNRDSACAAILAPPEVMMSKYEASFSASRAALKDWEHTLNVKRTKFTRTWYQHVYNFWLEVQILKNKIQAPGYLLARMENNYMVVDSYRMCRFVGPQVPHIDPLKEVMAERAKLGVTGAAIPLTTVERATERLDGGESISNMEQYADELNRSKDLGLEIELPGESDIKE